MFWHRYWSTSRSARTVRTRAEVPADGDDDVVVLHRCRGEIRVWADRGWWAQCTGCGETVAADCPPLDGHAALDCPVCGRLVGLCPTALLAEMADTAERIVSGR